MEKYAHPFIENIMKDPLNKKCFDCGTSHPKWASINNSVIVCLNCAGVHRGLGVGISFIRSLTMDNWDEKHLKYLKSGGNKRMKEFLEEYDIPISTDIELKYRLNALEYYRKMVNYFFM
jgi:ADP-ribosylation factor GTPase-activating protein 1